MVGRSQILSGVLLALCVAIARPAGAESEGWPRHDTPLLRQAVPDLRALNHRPAGALGRVRAEGARLVHGDGSEARFWGANLQAYALFRTPPALIPAHARRIAALGFNLIRIHHHDSHWVRPNIFGDRADQTTELHAPSLARLDAWIAALKAEGVYVWLDLHVGRRLTEADGIADFAEMAAAAKDADKGVDLRGYNYISESIAQAMEATQRAYLSHVNPLTGLAYAADPAILAVLITNENDATHHFGNRLLPDKGVPTLSARYMAEARAFARTHGLPARQTWRSWEPGPSKLFLADLERRFHARMIAGVRETGFAGLVAPTSTWGRNPLFSLAPLTIGDLIDVHSYGGPEGLMADPRTTPGFLDWVAAAQLPGTPLSISEWNISPFPAEARFVAPLRMAAASAHQGWDAPMVYGYAQQALDGPTRRSNWHIANDPAMIAMMPAAALLFRQGHVAPADETYVLRLPPDRVWGTAVSPKTSAAIRTLTERHRLVVELPTSPALPWLDPPRAANAIPVTDPDRAYLPPEATRTVSDTGEIARDFAREIFTVDTPRSQIAAGRIGGTEIALSDVTLALETPLAAVAVQSLDDAPLRSADRLLISLTARADAGPDTTSWRVEPLAGTLRITADPGLTLRRAGSDAPLPPGAHRLEDGTHIIDLGLINSARWLLLER